MIWVLLYMVAGAFVFGLAGPKNDECDGCIALVLCFIFWPVVLAIWAGEKVASR